MFNVYKSIKKVSEDGCEPRSGAVATFPLYADALNYIKEDVQHYLDQVAEFNFTHLRDSRYGMAVYSDSKSFCEVTKTIHYHNYGPSVERTTIRYHIEEDLGFEI